MIVGCTFSRSLLQINTTPEPSWFILGAGNACRALNLATGRGRSQRSVSAGITAPNCCWLAGWTSPRTTYVVTIPFLAASLIAFGVPAV